MGIYLREPLSFDAHEFRALVEKCFEDEVRKARQNENENFTVTGPSLFELQRIRYELFAGNSPAKAITAIRLSSFGEVVVKFGIVDDLDDENRTETALYVCVEWNEYMFENVISIQSPKFLYEFIIPYVRTILSGNFEIIKPSRLRSMYFKVDGRVPWKPDFYLFKIFDREDHVLITQNLRLDFH